MSGATKYKDATSTNKRQIFVNNFIGGIGWALGATVGVSLLIGVIAILVHSINVVPVVGQFVSDVANYVFRNNPNFK